MVGVGAGLVVFALAMLVLAVAAGQDFLVVLLPSVSLGLSIGALCRMVIDHDWPAFRGRANEAEAARELRYHSEMASMPAAHLTVLRAGDRIPDDTGEHAPLRAVRGHRAGSR